MRVTSTTLVEAVLNKCWVHAVVTSTTLVEAVFFSSAQMQVREHAGTCICVSFFWLRGYNSRVT